MSAVQTAAPARESNAVRAWIAKRPVVSFYLLTLTLSWGYWLTLLLQGRRVVPGGVATHFPGLLVATEIGAGLPAAIVSTAVMAWGVVVAVRWWRGPADPPRLDPLLEPVTPRAGAGERGP